MRTELEKGAVTITDESYELGFVGIVLENPDGESYEQSVHINDLIAAVDGFMRKYTLSLERDKMLRG